MTEPKKKKVDVLMLYWHSQYTAPGSGTSGKNRWSVFKWEGIECFNSHTSLIQFYTFDFCFLRLWSVTGSV